MKTFQKIGATIAVVGALGGCWEPINNADKFAQWNAQQTDAIVSARTISDLVKIPDLEKNIKQWVWSPYNTWNMQVMQTTKDGFAGVEQNATISIKFWSVKEGTFFARFTDPKDQKSYKDFAIICANGMLSWMNNLRYSPPVNIPSNTTNISSLGSWGVDVSDQSKPTEYIIPKGGSIMGTMPLNRQQAEELAQWLRLPIHNTKDWKLIVTVHPWDVFAMKWTDHRTISYISSKQ
jgi:hypothetical protein